MKYIKGTQDYEIGENANLIKFNLICKGESEGIWAVQGPDTVTLQNHALCFYPFPSWGVVLPSKNPPGNNRERIDVTELRGTSPDKTVLTLHPEAWKQYLEHGTIDEDGNFIIPKEEKSNETVN
jgi:hypothetical protein